MLDFAAAAQPTLNIKSLSIGAATAPRGRNESTVAAVEAEPGGLWALLQRAAGYGRTVTMTLTSQRVVRVIRGRNDVCSTSMPLAQMATMDYDYDRPITKLVVGMLATMLGLGGVFAIGPLAVLGVVAGGLIIAWHFLSGPKFAMKLVGTNGVSVHLKVKAGTQTEELIEFVELVSEQLRTITHAQMVAPPAMPVTQQGIVVRS
ncbi:MAG: hypothetical protein ABI321_13565 [Polyangia bacterium]